MPAGERCALFAQNPLARILNLAMVVLYVIGAWLLQGAITVHPRELGTPLQDDVAWYVFGCTPWFSPVRPILVPLAREMGPVLALLSAEPRGPAFGPRGSLLFLKIYREV